MHHPFNLCGAAIIYINMSYINDVIASQQEAAKQRQEALEARKQEYEEYLQSEQAKRDAHEHYQDLWEAKAKREGWSFKREPFISAADRQKMAEQERQEKIAYLEEQLKQLKNN